MSFSKLLQKIVSKLGNLHESSATSPGGLNNVEQINGKLLEVKTKETKFTDSELESLSLYDKARIMHLNENYSDARKIYLSLTNFSKIEVIEDSARFFLGVTFYDEHKYVEAEKYFKNAIVTHPDDLWINSEFRFLSESLIAQGKIEEAKKWLKKSSSQGAQVRFAKLDESLLSGLNVPFISY